MQAQSSVFVLYASFLQDYFQSIACFVEIVIRYFNTKIIISGSIFSDIITFLEQEMYFPAGVKSLRPPDQKFFQIKKIKKSQLKLANYREMRYNKPTAIRYRGKRIKNFKGELL